MSDLTMCMHRQFVRHSAVVRSGMHAPVRCAAPVARARQLLACHVWRPVPRPADTGLLLLDDPRHDQDNVGLLASSG